MRLLMISLLALGCKDDPIPPSLPDCTIGFADRDGDGFGSNLETSDCQEPIVDNNADCDDLLLAVNPDAIEVCDTIDNNCDGLIDLDDPTIEGGAQFVDADDDGYGTGEAVLLCEPIAGYVTVDGDCNDTVPEINPDAVEVCDGVDNDCDEQLDDADDDWDSTSAPAFFEDLDGDGFGSDIPVLACVLPPDATTNAADCDDAEATSFPGAPERCNNLDSDCDGAPDGSTVQLDACGDLEQTYSGPYTVDLVQGTTQRTCSGTADIVIDRAQDPVVQGTFTCTFPQAAGGIALTHNGLFEGWVTRDGLTEGTVTALAGTVRDYEGLVTPGAFTADADGLQLDGATAWDMEMTVDANPTGP